MASNESKNSSTLVLNKDVVGSFQPAKVLNYHNEASIISLDFDDSGQYLISAGVDKTIQLYNIHKGIHQDEIQSRKYGAHLARFTHNQLNCLYASTPTIKSSSEHAIRYLALTNNQYIRYFKGHSQQVKNLEVSPVDDIFISSSYDRTVKIWDLKSPSAVGNVYCEQPTVVTFDPKGMIFAVGKFPNPSDPQSSSGSVSLYDLRTFDKGPFLTSEFDILPGQEWNKIEISNNGKLILVSTDSPHHYVLDAFSGQHLTTLDLMPGGYHGNTYKKDWMTFKYPHSGSTSLTTCGKFAIAGSASRSICIFDLNSIRTTEGDTRNVNPNDNPKILYPFKEVMHTSLSKIVAFNPKLLTFASADTTVTLWQPKVRTA